MRGKIFFFALLMLLFGTSSIFYVGCNEKTSLYTVSFNSNEGSDIPPIINLPNGSKIIEPTIPVKTGYLFGGWYRENDCIHRWNFTTDVVVLNITLHAKWSQISLGPAGGYVFYDKGYYSEGWRYLESAPVSTERTRIWGSDRVNVQITEKGIGTGKYNTREILRRYGYTGGDAARYCDYLVV